MGLIPQDVIDAVLAAHDIVEVIGRYVPLKPAGRAFKALCPFHEEKTPSFTVNPDRQSFKCFGCGKGGNIFGFLIEHEGLSFPEAVRSLAEERSIPVPQTESRTPQEEGRVEGIRRALAFAETCFVKALGSDEGREARSYLVGRGYNEEAIRRFGLGYAPPGWDRLLAAGGRRGLKPEILEAAGLVVARPEGGHYDRFRHRVIFPITDLQGRVITFGARALSDEDQPKYLNGPETLVFKKANVLYALDRARDGIRRADEALLMEGYTDVLTCHLHGVDRAVAGMGTAFTDRQAGLIKRFASRVVLVYDGDEPGRQAAERTLDILLVEGLDVRVVLLPQDRDVDEILLEEGPEALEARVAEALDLLAFKQRVLADRHDTTTPHGRARMAEAVVATILRVPSPVEQDQLLRALAEQLGGVGAEEALRRTAAELVGRSARRPRRTARPAGEQVPTPRPETVPERKRREAEEFLLAGFLFHPDLRDQIQRAVGPEDFVASALRRIYDAALRLREEGEAFDQRVLAARLSDDLDAQTALAGLPEDATLDERIPFQIEYMEHQRRTRRRALEIRRELGGRAATSPSDPEGTAHDGGRSDEDAPREQVG